MRTRLLWLVLSALVPVIVFAAVLASLQVESEREAVRNGALDRTRAIMSAVDAELRGSIATLQSLASSRALEAGDLAAFHAEMVRVLASNPSWQNVTLTSPATKQQVANAAVPYGAALPIAGDLQSLEDAALKLRPVVGGVSAGPVTKQQGVVVRVPVVRNGRAAYVLTGIMRPETFLPLVQGQRLERGWVSGLTDANGTIVARVPAVPIGTRASEAFRASVALAPEGWYRGQTVEGNDTYTAHVTSAFSGWSIGLALPADAVHGPARRAMLLAGIGASLSIALALLLAFWLGRRIEQPVASLAAAARSLGRGARIPVDDAGVREVAEVATALAEADEAVRERERLLQREKDLLQESDRAKDEFLAMLSHELRNPLAGLVNAAHVLKIAPPGHDSAIAARQVIERQTAHMRRLVEDLLDVSSVTMGKTTLLRERLRLDEAVETVFRTWRAAGRLARHDVQVEAKEAWVEADRARLEQVISNLLDNAIKFTPAGKSISIRVSREGGEARLVVADEGEGIAPEKLDSVFELFMQADAGADRGRGGMGIGLALVRKLVELHGGSVAAASAGKGRGCAFTVRLPAVEPAAPELQHAGMAQPPDRATVLVVEDNEDTRRSLADALSLVGHRVLQAHDGASAIALAGEARPDVVLIDIGLPDMDGYEVARRLRLLQWQAAPTLVALTGYGQQNDRRRAIEVGFDLHLTKPVPPEQLEHAIEACLQTRGRAAA